MLGRASQAFDRLNGDAAFERLLNEDAGDQRARFGHQLAQARLDASQQRAEFDIQLAKLEGQLAEALRDASQMRVGPCMWVRPTSRELALATSTCGNACA